MIIEVVLNHSVGSKHLVRFSSMSTAEMGQPLDCLKSMMIMNLWRHHFSLQSCNIRNILLGIAY